MNTIPTSLYIHIPWCIKKCPYCDFNSHVARQEIPEQQYLDALKQDFEQQQALIAGRKLCSIFIGGGTPSLMSPAFYSALLAFLEPHLMPDCEITLEANPGTIDFQHDNTPRKFHDYRQLGINRLSLGIQSLQDDKLKYLGRMHSADNAIKAIQLAKEAGFEQLNCDLMFGLPKQTQSDALSDLQTIIDLNPSHLSWYQLTIEPNTHFFRRRPVLPEDDLIFDMQQAGIEQLEAAGFRRYETSAFARDDALCQHNMNYWQFGDYLGIGAGAHGKITNEPNVNVLRSETPKHPRLYVAAKQKHQLKKVKTEQLGFEFMLNALRLHQPIPYELFEQRTGLSANVIMPTLEKAQDEQLMTLTEQHFCLTLKGQRFVNEILESFLTL